MLRTCMSTVRVLSTSRGGDLAVGEALGDQAHDLDLAAREPRGLVLGGGAAAQVLGRPTRRARRPPQPPRAASGRAPQRVGEPVGLGQLVQRRVALAGRGQRRGAADQDLRALERDARGRRAARRRGRTAAAAASASPSASAVSAIAQASAASASACPADAAIDDSASVHARASSSAPGAREPAGRPAQAPDRVVVVLAALPAGEHERGSAPRRARVLALLRGQPRERRGAVALHRDDVQPRRRLQAARQQRPGRAARCRARPAIAPRTPSATSVSCGRRAGRDAAPRTAPATWSQSPSSRRT